jgi:hypothetical protein
MNIFRTERLRMKLRILSDNELWWLFVHHREECSREFWEEVENRKSAGILCEGSPFWAMGNVERYSRTRGAANSSNLIELTREEWEARRRRKLFRLISASALTAVRFQQFAEKGMGVCSPSPDFFAG